MGYCMDKISAKVMIKKDDFDKVIVKIQELANKVKELGSGGTFVSDNKGGSRKIESYYSWVRTEEFANEKNIERIFDAWRWHPIFDSDGNIIDFDFYGENLGDDTVLFNAIAEFVEKGSYIKMKGDDGQIWKWIFDGFFMEEIIIGFEEN